MTLKVGITGGIGSGKTLVCKIFKTLGAAVYHADEEARRIMVEDHEVRTVLTEILGKEAYSGKALNREYVASMLFNNAGLLSQVNSIVHPAVRHDFQKWIPKVSDAPYVIEEAAILFESGASAFLDDTILVYAPEETRIRRVVERDGVDPASVRQRMKHQMAEEEKKRLAGHVIINDGDHLLIPQVVDLHTEFINRIK